MRTTLFLPLLSSLCLLAPGALAGPEPRGLLAARAGFVTQAAKSSFTADGPPEPAPPGPFQLVRYRAAPGPLAAYVTRDPGDGKRHPAVLWAHGGFGGVGPTTLEQVAPLVDAGLVVMCPSWRGENDNRGRYEMFYGEVEDALAALDHLSKLPYVDPTQLYVAGHSTGGTMALLLAESTDRLRAAYSLGGAPDMERVVKTGGYDVASTPFPVDRPREAELRSALRFVGEIRSPVHYFEGAKSTAYLGDAQKMVEAARARDVPFSSRAIWGGDHFTIVTPLLGLIAKKIVDGTPDVTADEAQAAFAATRPKVTIGYAPAGFEMELDNRGADVCHALPVARESEGGCDGYYDPAVARRGFVEHPQPSVEIVSFAFTRLGDWDVMIMAAFLKQGARSLTFDDPQDRDDYVKGMRGSVPGTRIHGDAPGSDYTTITLNDRPALRFETETPVPDGSPEADFNRAVSYALPTKGGVLLVQFSAGEPHLPELRRFAENSFATIKLKSPPPATPRVGRSAALVGGILAVLAPFALIALGAVVSVVVFGRKYKDRA